MPREMFWACLAPGGCSPAATTGKAIRPGARRPRRQSADPSRTRQRGHEDRRDWRASGSAVESSPVTRAARYPHRLMGDEGAIAPLDPPRGKGRRRPIARATMTVGMLGYPSGAGAHRRRIGCPPRHEGKRRCYGAYRIRPSVTAFAPRRPAHGEFDEGQNEYCDNQQEQHCRKPTVFATVPTPSSGSREADARAPCSTATSKEWLQRRHASDRARQLYLARVVWTTRELRHNDGDDEGRTRMVNQRSWRSAVG